MPYKNHEDHLAFRRRYKKTGNWRTCTKYYDAAKHANQRAAIYGAPGKITATDVRAILESNPDCFYCGSKNYIGIDHRVPLYLKGINAPENIVSACRSCNISKWLGQMPHQWSSFGDSCCKKCGTKERKHISHGLCGRCYRVDYPRRPKRDENGKDNRHLQLN